MQPSDTHQMESTQPRHYDEGSTVSLDQLANRPGSMMPTTRRGSRLRPPPALNPSATALLRVLRYRWILALGLGLAAAVVVAALTWFIVPRAKDQYDALGLLSVGVTTPRVVQGNRDLVDFGTYRRTQSQLAKSLSVAKAALKRPEAEKLLAEHRQNADTVAKEIQKNIKVDSGAQEWPSQILPVTLTWPNNDEAVVFVNSVMEELVDEASKNDEDDNRKRYALVAENYKDSQKEAERLHANINALKEKMAALTTADEQQLQNEIALLQGNFSKEEIEYIRAKQRKAAQEMMSGKEKPKTFVVTNQMVEDFVLKEAEIRGFLNEIDRADKLMAQLRIIAAAPESLPEYQEYIAIKNELNQKIDRKKAELRPVVRARLEKIAVGKPEDDDSEYDRINIAQTEKTLKNIKDSVKAKAAELARMADARRKQEISLEDKIETAKAELVQRQKQAEKLLEEKQTLEVELNGRLSRLKIEQRASEAEKVIGKDPNNAIRTVGLAAIGAFCLAALGVGWWEFRSRRIHTTDELAGQLGLRMIGTVPTLPEGVRRQPIPVHGQEMYWHSRLTEAVDSITTLLLHEASQVGARALLVTSAVGHEGKTTLACHLATSLARAGKRTLLIDGDLVHPTAHLMFNEGLEPGLSDLLRGQCNVPDVVRPTQASGLWMITAGQADSAVVQALARDAMQPLLEMLKSEYDFIIIDSSPVLPLAHALLIGKHCDAAVLAVRRDISRVMPVYAAHQRLATLGIPVLGAVFMEQNNPGYDSYTYSEGSIPGQTVPPAPPAVV
ncbi:MAG TPA: polysaccharide biosynthesis tyrosine autokinase [Gemmataceae bacterium]|nr:polysaccharide biosynthesis tyrosine autokinase [Gemmataceae bacterium]